MPEGFQRVLGFRGDNAVRSVVSNATDSGAFRKAAAVHAPHPAARRTSRGFSKC